MCAVSLGWSGRECVRLAGDRVRDVRSEGKARLLQAPPFPTTAWLCEHGSQVDPACGYGHEDMVAYRPNYSHVLGEGVRPRLNEERNRRFRRAGEIQPKHNPDGLLVALAVGRLVEPESLQLRNCERVYIGGSARWRRWNGGEDLSRAADDPKGKNSVGWRVRSLATWSSPQGTDPKSQSWSGFDPLSAPGQASGLTRCSDTSCCGVHGMLVCLTPRTRARGLVTSRRRISLLAPLISRPQLSRMTRSGASIGCFCSGLGRHLAVLRRMLCHGVTAENNRIEARHQDNSVTALTSHAAPRRQNGVEKKDLPYRGYGPEFEMEGATSKQR